MGWTYFVGNHFKTIQIYFNCCYLMFQTSWHYILVQPDSCASRTESKSFWWLWYFKTSIFISTLHLKTCILTICSQEKKSIFQNLNYKSYRKAWRKYHHLNYFLLVHNYAYFKKHITLFNVECNHFYSSIKICGTMLPTAIVCAVYKHMCFVYCG